MRPGEGRSAQTRVDPRATRAEIEALLMRYGATGFISGWQDLVNRRLSSLEFEMRGRRFRIAVATPDRTDRRITHGPGGKRRSEEGIEAAFQQAERQAWRNVLDLLRAILICVDTGILTLDTVMLPYLVLPDGSMEAQWLGPQIEQVYRSGRMPELLPGISTPMLEDGKGGTR